MPPQDATWRLPAPAPPRPARPLRLRPGPAARRQAWALLLTAALLGQHAAAGGVAAGAVAAAAAVAESALEGSHGPHGAEAAAGAAPGAEETEAAEWRAAEARRLRLITTEFNASLTALSLSLAIGSPIQCLPGSCTAVTGLYAGLEVTSVEITVDPDMFFAPGALLRVVRAFVDRNGALLGYCLPDSANGARAAVVNAPWAADGAPTTGSGSANLQSGSSLTFKMGGTFRLCYSDDGSFTNPNADVVPPLLSVYGIYDEREACATVETCLTTRQYRCYLLRQAFNNPADSFEGFTSCVVEFDYIGAGFEGPVGKGSWSRTFGATYDSAGLVTGVAQRTCAAVGEMPEAFLCNTGGACDVGDPFVPMNITRPPNGGRLQLPTGRNDLVGASFRAHTVAACYCPDFNACDSYTPDYLQQVGILHYYVGKVCHNGYQATACSTDYTGATPQHRFALRVECPTDACSAQGVSRVKVAAQTPENDLPAWDARAGCGGALHGFDAGGKLVLPPEVNLVDVGAVHGGGRQDWKLWNFRNSSSGYVYDVETSGFLFKMGPTDHELRTSHNGETFDVCYCDDDCHLGTNWFKVGQLRFAPFQLVSAMSNESAVQEQFVIEYVNQPGILGLYRPWVDYGVMGLQPGGMVKPVADPTLSIDDAGCAAAIYDRTIVERTNGLSELTAHTRYRGSANQTVGDPNKLVFNGDDPLNLVTIKRPGFLAICYCSNLNPFDQSCALDHWVLTARITIRGPALGQHWTFSTHVVFRFEFTGWGLTKDDRVRIVPSTGTCSGDPNAAYTATNIKLNCPDPCSEVGDVTDVLNGDIEVTPLADDAYMCNEQNVLCRTNFIKTVTVLDENTTAIEFESPPYLSDGDLITLGDNILCHPQDPPHMCNEERLSILLGRYRLVDRTTNHVGAPDEYIAGHAVTTTANNKIVTIRVGWPVPRPRFHVAYVNNQRGRWMRHSRAVTRQEILGTRERLDMKICWKYAPAQRALGPTPSYVGQVGTLTLMDPNPLIDCMITLSTTVVNQKSPYAPFILSFKTAGEETGRKYSQVPGTTRLRIFFESVLDMRATFADGAPIENNPGEDDVGEARQYICGKIFKELWSSDAELGFPMPKGCYYRVYDQTQEINVLLDVKNGLRAAQNYQLVLSGVAGQFAVTGGEYAQVFTMDDTDLRPYNAIERGVARLQRAPEASWYGSDGVKFFEPDGVKIVGGAGANMLELKDGQELRIELKGDPLAGGIKRSSIIRIFLWPLTAWDVPNNCVVHCIPFDDVTAPCGAVQDCKGDSLIQNFHKNYLRVIMPANMHTMDHVISHTLVFPELSLPKGGFFPTRLAMQVSQADDTKPHYMETVGDFLYKVPDEGQGVGKLVDFYGDGNQRPFRGDSMNILYARIILAATLFSVIQTGDAVMTITLPPGYECVRTVDINGRSPWRTEETLGVFGDESPQGTGLPDEGSGARGWSVHENTCTYTLRQNAVIFAGSALTIRVTVNNPDTSLKVADPSNRWNVTLYSKGYHQWPVTFPPLVFKTGGTGNYSDNMAVLGRLSDASLVPSNFAFSTDAFQVSMGEIKVFFRTEQETGVHSAVELQAPVGFLFVPQDNCGAAHLEDLYYAVRGGQSARRLPGIAGCVHEVGNVNRALVKLTGSMLAQTCYAFRIRNMQNPIAYNLAQQGGWHIYTVDSSGSYVDGLPHNIPLASYTSANPAVAAATNLSFGLYQRSLNTPGFRRADVFVSEMLPYSITGLRAKVTVLPLRIPVNSTTTLRIVAPRGFVWDFAPGEFRYRLAGPNVSAAEVVAGVSADLPGGLPVQDGSVLLWGPVNYGPQHVYGFEAHVRVPDQTPTTSINEFIFEYGHTEDTLSGRIAASTVKARFNFGPVPAPVRALASADLDYTSSVISKANLLIFQVETVTRIPVGGGLRITGPSGFVLQSACSVVAAPPVRRSPYDVFPALELPAGMACSAAMVAGGQVEIRLGAGVGSEVPPGRYRFQIAATNPASAMPNPALATSPCGFRHCWLFESLKFINAANSPPLDSKIHVPGFAVNSKLVEALMPQLELAQQAATGRNDRPGARNPLVFAFKLNRAALDLGVMKVRAPEGSVFRENCLEDVETRGYKVFGEGQPLPAMYGSWDIEIPVLRCRGEGPDAFLTIDAAGSATGLLPERLYPFRVALLHNPETMPSPNEWTMEFNGESSDPFPGYDLWTFTRTSILTVSLGRSTPRTGATKLANPVTFTFNPHNEVRGSHMKVKITAPQNFEIAHTDYRCGVLIQLVSAFATGLERNNDTAPAPNFVGPPSLIWGEADVECTVDRETGRTMTADVLAASQAFLAGRDYQLTVRVHNPTITSGPADWLLETEASPAQSGVLPTFRDLRRVPGYHVHERASQWMYRNEDPVTGLGFFRGVTDVPGLYFEMQFPSKLERGDVIRIQAPSGFSFAGGGRPGAPAPCGGFRWEPRADAAYYLPNSLVQCEGGLMHFFVQEPKAIPEMRLIKFRADTRNPPKTPHVMENFWSVFLLDAAGVGIRATSAAESWVILPQLYNVNVLLTGARKAEGSRSTVAVSFMPVSDADQLELVARLPSGFDFTGCVATSVGHEVISTSVERLGVRASIYADVQVDVVIEGLSLGLVGGATEFDLKTKLNNGVQMDEKLGFRGGFRLPGRVTVTQKRLTSKYSQDPVLYPVSSLWDTRMGERATAEFDFRLTVMADRQQMIRLRAPPYELMQENFRIVRLSTNLVVTAEVISASAGGLVAKLGAPLWADTAFRVSVDVVTPLVPDPRDAMWSLDLLDGGALPVNTNDALTEGFQLVDRIEVAMSVRRSPPMALVPAVVNIDPKSTVPEFLILIAPPGFGFPANCLVSGGLSGEILSCQRVADVRGRAAARLQARAGGLRARTEYVTITIATPAHSAAEPTWYIEGRSASRQLGWGGDPVGVEILQMRGAGVLFPGVPSISGQMVFRFITGEKIEAGGKLEVGYPTSIAVSCEGAFLQKIALEGDVRCVNSPREGKFELSLSRPLPPGQQAFGVTSTCPFAVSDNRFSIKVVDSAGQVVDAAMGIPGSPIQHGLALAALPLIWSISEANMPATVSLGVELVQELPGVDPPVMSEIVVRVPRDFTQQVSRLSHIEVLNDPLPWRGTGSSWLDVTDPLKINFLLDEQKTPRLPVGRYRLSFPVRVPSRMPKYNVFIITVCGPRGPSDAGRCTGETDPRALISFPIAGFGLGEVHPSAARYTVTGAGRLRAAVPRCLLAALLLAAGLPRP